MTPQFSNAPIAIFAYRRADSLSAMLSSLQNCEGFKDSPVIAFVDGPKGDADALDVKDVLARLQELNWPNLSVVAADENRGLKRSIFIGVSAVIREYGRAIVLEDDLFLSEKALVYFNAALQKYQNDCRIKSISGYMYDVPELRGRTDAFFLPLAQSWGWATWERAWQGFEIDTVVDEIKLRSPSFRHAFSMNGTADYATMLSLDQQKKLSSWFVRWNYKILSEGGLVLFPPRSLIANRGYGSRGATHSSWLSPYEFLVKPAQPADHAPNLPDDVGIDFLALDQIPRSWEARIIKTIQTIGHLKRRFR